MNYVRRGPLLLGGLAIVNVALFAAYSAVISVLIPRQVEVLAPQDKVGALALVLSISFAVTMFAQPLFGALSDGTTGRFGRRVPWMLGGAVVGGAALGLAGGATSIAALAVAWAVGQFALNGTDIASSALLVDRVPRERRGLSFAILGVAAIVGGALGAVFAGRVTGATGPAYWLLAGIVVAVVLLFSAVVRDRGDGVREPGGGAGAFFGQFRIDPRRHPDFFKLLGWKLSSTLAYAAVHGYLLYLLTDYIGLGDETAGMLVGTLTVVGGAGVIVGLFVGGLLSDRLQRRTPFLLAGGVLLVAGDLVAILVPSVVGVAVLAAALGLSLGLSIACGTALGSELLPRPADGVGGGLGILNFGGNLAQAIAPLLAAAAITSAGGYFALFLLSIVAALVAIILAATIRGRR